MYIYIPLHGDVNGYIDVLQGKHHKAQGCDAAMGYLVIDACLYKQASRTKHQPNVSFFFRWNT